MKSISTALAAGALAAAGALGTGIAAADPDPTPSTHPIGSQGTVTEGPGVHGWTINDLRPSPDAIPYQPRGTLWEATATDEAIQGTVFPIVANLSARSASGQNYQALFTVPTSQGIVPMGLSQGQKASGKVYFDVTGDAPNSMVYQTGGNDLIRWVAPVPQAPPAAPQPQAPAAGSGSQAPATGGNGHRAPTPPRAPSPQPTRPGSATSPPAGSSGTPLPEGSSGTPLPAEAPDSSASSGSSGASAGTPAP